MLTSATEAEFTAFQIKYGYTVTADPLPLLALSFSFLQTLPWKIKNQESTDSIIEAQCFIAISIYRDEFDPSARIEDMRVTKKKVDTLEKHFEANDYLQGTDPVTLLRSMPIAYGLLYPYLSPSSIANGGLVHDAGVFVV